MKEKTRETIKTVLKKLGATGDVTVEDMSGQTIFQVQTTESRRLIGMRGETLHALEYVVKKMLEKEAGEDFQFTIDVDGYKAKQIKDLQQKARMMAERAKSFKYDVELTPMSSYERLIVHAALSGMPEVKTESRGEGRDRRVVIRYVPETENTREYAARLPLAP